MRYYTLLLLATSWTIGSSEEIKGLDKDVFQQVQEVSKIKGSKEADFIKKVWSELTRFLPVSARIPGVELPFELSTDKELEDKGKTAPEGTVKGDYFYNNFICATECKIHPKLVETDGVKIITKEDGKAIIKGEDKVVVEVKAKFIMDKTEMVYNLYQKLGGSNDAQGPIPVKYKFEENSKMQLILEIPNFSKVKSITDASCLVYLRSLEITELSKPKLENTLKAADEEIAEYYWDLFAVKSQEMKTVMSIGARRAISLKLQDAGDYWICLSDGLKEQIRNEESQYSYKPIYQEYCKDYKIAD